MSEGAYKTVLVPRESANDDFGVVVSWAKEDGQPVSAGETICELEFSKSITEVTAPVDGYLFRMHELQAEAPVGGPLALIASTPVRPDLGTSSEAVSTGPKITAKARLLMTAHGLTADLFPGLAIIREEHVQRHLDAGESAPANPGEGELVPTSAVRRRAAAVLADSKRSIPHSYLSVWMPAAALERRLEQLTSEQQLMISLSDLLVATIATAASGSTANSGWRDGSVFRYSRVNVGFALNQPNGDLLVPVVPDADKLSLADVAAMIRTLQKKAIRQQLSATDLSGGTITVTSLLGTGVHQVLPIIVPGQSVIIAIADRCDWPTPCHCLTIAFDHRVLNGAEAGEFLRTIAEGLQGGTDT
jgi:pyruvate/2-oxoglutarate dehydrogenase complex dihydrolipoamide acyltransferase (E2) component